MVYIQLEHFWRFVIDHWERDLVQLRFNSVLDWETVFFFFLNFFFVSFYRIFYTYFPLLSPVSLTPPLPSPPAPAICSRQERTTICSRSFAPDHSIDYSAFLAYAKSAGRFVGWKTDWRFSVTETLAVILNCRWQVKRLKVPFNSVWKENIVFFAKKIKHQQQQQ